MIHVRHQAWPPDERRNRATRPVDGRIQRSLPKSTKRAGYDDAKRNKGTNPHLADTLGHLLVRHVTPASTDDRAERRRLEAGTGRDQPKH